MKRPSRILRRRNGGEDETYQLDAIVSLFAVILLVLLLAAAAAGTGSTRLDYRTHDADAPLIRLSSFASPYPRLDTWVLGQKSLVRLDYDAAARLLAQAPASGAAGVADPESGIDLRLEVSSSEPGSYERLVFVIPLAPRQGGVAAEVLDPAKPGAAKAWARKAASPILLIVRSQAVGLLPRFEQSADERGIPWRMAFAPGGPTAPIATRRSAASFSARNALRVY